MTAILPAVDMPEQGTLVILSPKTAIGKSIITDIGTTMTVKKRHSFHFVATSVRNKQDYLFAWPDDRDFEIQVLF